jgi:hypothetical protein
MNLHRWRRLFFIHYDHDFSPTIHPFYQLGEIQLGIILSLSVEV